MKNFILLFFFLNYCFTQAQTASDDCVSPTSIPVTTSSALQITTDFNNLTESDPLLTTNCETNASTVYLDGWFQFTMPVNGNIYISNAFSVDSFTLYDSCGGTELDCGFADEIFYNLTAGNTYVLRQSRNQANAGVSGFAIQAFAEISNNDCDFKTTIGVNTTGVTSLSVDFRGATEDDPLATTNCETTPSHDYLDVWWDFTMPVDGNISISNAFSLDSFTLYNSCGGTEIDCGFGNEIFYGLTSGVTYVLRQARRDLNAGASSFDIQAFAEITNDDCDFKTTINVNTSGVTSLSVDFRGATEDDPIAITNCETNPSQDYLDVWWDFTMPVNGNISISNAFSLDSFTLYDSCGGTEIDCGFGNEIFYGLTSGTTYVLRHARRDINAGASSFDIQAFGEIANDNCTDRTTVNVTTTDIITLSSDFRSATEDNSTATTNCETNASQDYLDVWFEFVMPVDGNLVITDANSTQSFTLYSIATSPGGCFDVELDCGFGNEIFYNLTENTTYILRHAQRDIFADGIEDFNIKAVAVVSNDACADASPIIVSTTEALTYTANMQGATEDNPAYTNTCETNAAHENLDVWWNFDMPVDGTLLISNVPSTVSFTLFDDCNGTEIVCGFGQEFFYQLDGQTTYKLRQAQRDIFAAEIAFTVQAFANPANDACTTAEIATVGVVSPAVTAVDFIAFTPSDSTMPASGPEPSCENAIHTYHDAFYEVVMPFDGTLEVSNTASTNLFALYEDDCDGAEVGCFFNDGSYFNLEGGETYVLQVARRDIFANSAPVNFSLQAIPSPLAPCVDTTEFIAGMWSNGLPDITKNAIIRSNYNTQTTLDINGNPYGSFEACSLSIDTGTTLTVEGEDYVDVGFGVTVNGTLNVSHQGSIVQRDASAGTINNGAINVTVITPFLKPRDFMIMGSPMSVETRDGVWNTSFGVFNHTTSNFTPNTDVTTAFPNAENFVDDTGDDFNQYSGTISPGEGYLVRPQASILDGNATYTHVHQQGVLNNGDITYPVVFNTDKISSFNLLANPYPSPILADDFINENTMVDEVYFWEHITPPSTDFPGWNNVNFTMEDISMYNLMGGVAATSDVTGTDTEPNGYIATAQGFGIKASAAGTATFTNLMRRINGNTTLRAPEAQKDRLWITIENETYGFKNSMLLGFTDDATQGFDAGFDSKRIPTTVSIFSHLEENTAELAIQSREAFEASITIPVGVSSQIEENTSFTISLEKLEGIFNSNVEIYLLDTVTNERIPLNNETYTFNMGQGSFASRFILYFKDNSLNVNASFEEAISLFPNPATNTLYVSGTDRFEMISFEIIDVTGRKIAASNDVSQIEKGIEISSLQAGNYIVVFQSDEGKAIKRFIKK